MRELEHKRTRFSKTFDLGNGQHRLEVGQLPRHFERDGKLHDIDLTPEGDAGRRHYVLRNCPYSLRIDKDAPAYAYNSLSGKRVSVELVTTARGCLAEDGLYKWSEVGPDTDYVIQPLPQGCATLLFLHSAKAPRRWSWRVQGDISLIHPLVGKDSTGRRLELIERRIPESGEIEIEWTGRTVSASDLRRNGRASWSEEVTWPVFIDPTVNENIAANGDDARSFWMNGTAFSTFTAGDNLNTAGRFVSQFPYVGLRFQTIAVPAGATINSATLTVRTTVVVGSPNINIYGNDVDDAAVWADPDNRIKNIAKTTAVTNRSSWTANADNAITVTAIVAEIIARAGWASNNDIAFGLFNAATAAATHAVQIVALEHATLTEARLSINYTAAAATVDADASSAGAATAVVAGAPVADAAMNAAGVTAAEAVGEAVLFADGAMNGAGSATTAAEGASLADGAMSADGAAVAIAESEGGIVIVVPDFTPVGGGGAIPPVRDRDKRFRIRKDTTQPHVIRVGDWPTEAQMAEMADALARAERQDFARFISGIQEPEPVEDYDEDEQALMLILAAA